MKRTAVLNVMVDLEHQCESTLIDFNASIADNADITLELFPGMHVWHMFSSCVGTAMNTFTERQTCVNARYVNA